jgi:NADPH-dependent 2,4-dienoyl-CoA reductase/sulfur reductase-like enzyme
MNLMSTDRRSFLATSTALALSAPFGVRAQSAARIVIVGAGYGGASAARTLKTLGHDVVLIEASDAFVSCPFSNTVLGGFGEMADITFSYDRLAAAGIDVIHARAADVDAQAQQVILTDGTKISYDRLLLSPGVDMNFDALAGYDAAAAEIMPHAWKAGPQTALLRAQIEAMEDGGTVAISVPANPFRCPPGPYERASLIAYYLSTAKPRSKVLILDAKDQFSKRNLFEEAWAALYPGMIEWVPQSSAGTVTSVEPQSMTLVTDFARHKVAVANVIPPQRAGAIAVAAGVADETGWCPVSPSSFESTLVPGIHVIGDACFVGAMPKSAFSANAQAKVAAYAIDAILRGDSPMEPRLINTCFSLAAPDYGFTVAGVYRPVDGRLADIDDAGGTSPLGAAPEIRAQEADYARAWFATITAEAFG